MKAEKFMELATACMVLGMGTVGIGGALCFVQASAPDLGRRAAEQAAERPVRSLLAGIGGVLLMIVVLSVAKKGGPLPGLVVGLGVLLLLTLGVLAASRALGERIALQLERDVSPMGALAYGWLCHAALLIVPVVGWLLLAASVLVGVGAGLRALLGAGPIRPEVPTLEP